MPATQSQTIPWYCERYPVTVSNSRYLMCIWNIVSSFLFIGTTNSISELGPIRHRRREVIPLPSRMTPNPRLLSLGLGYVTHYIGWHSESLKSVPITVISWGIFIPATLKTDRCVIWPDLSMGYKKIAWTDPRCTPTASGRPYVYNGITPTLSASAHARCHRHISIRPELWGGSNSNKRYYVQYVSNLSLRMMQIVRSLTWIVKTMHLLCGSELIGFRVAVSENFSGEVLLRRDHPWPEAAQEEGKEMASASSSYRLRRGPGKAGGLW